MAIIDAIVNWHDVGRCLRVLRAGDSQRAIFIDPVVAVGYDYRIGKRNPRIATVRLPIGIGDSLYRLKVGGRKYIVAGGELFDFRAHGELFDFRAHGHRKGVEKFRVDCIEVDAMLDPANPQAFPTELTFMGAGMFTGTQKLLTRDSDRDDTRRCRAGDYDHDDHGRHGDDDGDD